MWKREEDGVEVGTAPVTLTTYTEAMNEFTKNATAFIAQIPLFNKARDSYAQAMKASAELRNVLDAGDESLRTLMAHLEQVVNVHVEKPGADKKKPELARIEPTKTETRPRAVNEFPV